VHFRAFWRRFWGEEILSPQYCYWGRAIFPSFPGVRPLW